MRERKRNDLVTYDRRRWRVIQKGSRKGYDLATSINGRTIISTNVPANKIHSVKKKRK